MKVAQMRLARPECTVMILTCLAVMVRGVHPARPGSCGNPAILQMRQVFSEIRLTGRDPPHIQHPLTATPPCAADANQCFSSSSGRSHPGQLAGKEPVSVERKLSLILRCLTFESEERETWTAVSLRDQLERVGPFER